MTRRTLPVNVGVEESTVALQLTLEPVPVPVADGCPGVTEKRSARASLIPAASRKLA